jgi:hypothetical protein
VLDEIRPDGTVTAPTALRAFVLACGPLPGVSVPPGEAGVQVVDGHEHAAGRHRGERGDHPEPDQPGFGHCGRILLAPERRLQGRPARTGDRRRDLVEHGVRQEAGQPGEGQRRLGLGRPTGQDPPPVLLGEADADPPQRGLADPGGPGDQQERGSRVGGRDERPQPLPLLVAPEQIHRHQRAERPTRSLSATRPRQRSGGRPGRDRARLST